MGTHVSALNVLCHRGNYYFLWKFLLLLLFLEKVEENGNTDWDMWVGQKRISNKLVWNWLLSKALWKLHNFICGRIASQLFLKNIRKFKVFIKKKKKIPGYYCVIILSSDMHTKSSCNFHTKFRKLQCSLIILDFTKMHTKFMQFSYKVHYRLVQS